MLFKAPAPTLVYLVGTKEDLRHRSRTPVHNLWNSSDTTEANDFVVSSTAWYGGYASDMVATVSTSTRIVDRLELTAHSARKSRSLTAFGHRRKFSMDRLKFVSCSSAKTDGAAINPL